MRGPAGPGFAHSAAAKAGVKNMVETLAVEWGPYGIQVNGLVPGLFPHEDMTADIQGNLLTPYALPYGTFLLVNVVTSPGCLSAEACTTTHSAGRYTYAKSADPASGSTVEVGDVVTYVRNRNINYTNVCTFKCRFCGFAKGPLSLNLRGKPYLLTLEDIAARVREAWQLGCTEVCLQGGVHPSFDGDYYLDVCAAVKQAAPEIHVHGFTALEVTEGAKRLGGIEALLGDPARAAG
jgi:hypothetical protein